VDWGGSGWIDLPMSPSVYVNDILSPSHHVVSRLRGRHGHHSHVPQADADRQLPGVLTQRPSTVVG
jgi:hypothetical protein